MGRSIARLLAVASLVAAASACTQITDAPQTHGPIVITAGSSAPDAVGGGVLAPQSNLNGAAVIVEGSTTSPVIVAGRGCTVGEAVKVTISYTVSGSQVGAASFEVETVWTYNGTEFIGSDKVTVNVPAYGGGRPRQFPVDVSIHVSEFTGVGETTILVQPVKKSGADFNINDQPATATIDVQFTTCEADNAEPHVTVPGNMTAEATSAEGATVDFVVSAFDDEDGDLTDQVTCEARGIEVTSPAQFPIGATEVTCSVEDSGGLPASGSFFIYVQDTTAPTFTAFPSDDTVIATDINGYALDLSAFEIAAADYGPDEENDGEVSPPVTIECKIGSDPADGYQIAIGQTAIVTCTATDSAEYRAPVGDDETEPPAPNVSVPQSFAVTVTLDVSDECGFEPPLRTEAPYSAHKANSTIPHKFCPPAYGGGVPAIDLASGLRLVLEMVGAQPDSDAIEANDFATGSTAWRYDDGHYIFNLKTNRNWTPGQYQTTVSFNGVDLATTEFALRK